MIKEKSWLFSLLEKFRQDNYINKYDYYLFDGLDKICPFMLKNETDEIYEFSLKNFNLSLEEVEEYAWEIKRKINELATGSRLIAFYMFFDRDMKKIIPFKDYESEKKARIKMIFCQIMDKISRFNR